MTASTYPIVQLLSDDVIRAIARAAFGERVRVQNCAPIEGGHFNTNYEIRTSSPDLHVVLRVAPHENHNLLRYERTMMLAEPIIYELIRGAGVPTAEVLAVDGSRSIIDRDYMIVRFIEAVPISDASVPEDVRRHLMREVGGLVRRIHGISASQFGWILPDGSVRGSTSWADVFGELLEDTLAKTLDAGSLSANEIDAALACFAANRSAFDECDLPRLVHNDVWHPNILVARTDGEWRVAGLIDADRALYADREVEAVLWDSPNTDLVAGYGLGLDASVSAVTRRLFYRLQLYSQYAWFYLVMRPSPDFQAESKRIVMDVLQELGCAVGG